VRYLFIHQNTPGQYLHLMGRLLRSKRNDLVTIGLPAAPGLEGVRKVVYDVPRSSKAVHPHALDFDMAMARAQAVARAAFQLQRLGFKPDIVLGHHGWGELLNIRDVWPDVPLLGYLEFYYHTEGADVNFDPEYPLADENRPRVRARNAVNLLALQLGAGAQTPTRWQRSTYPVWARRSIRLIPEGVDLTRCQPDPSLRTKRFTLPGTGTILPPGTPLLTYVARNLEPYRGFHIFMRALPRILRERPNLHVAIAGENGVSYGVPPRGARTYREALMKEVGDQLDTARVHFLGRIPYDSHVSLLQRSDVHVYLTYPFVASWSLREAMACGCMLVASDTAPVREFLADGKNALLTPFHSAEALSERVLQAVDDDALAQRLRRSVRRRAERTLSLDQHLAAFDEAIRDEVRR
jgi:glycosyltransferase involved in cell wall biosynthesis